MSSVDPLPALFFSSLLLFLHLSPSKKKAASRRGEQRERASDDQREVSSCEPWATFGAPAVFWHAIRSVFISGFSTAVSELCKQQLYALPQQSPVERLSYTSSHEAFLLSKILFKVLLRHLTKNYRLWCTSSGIKERTGAVWLLTKSSVGVCFWSCQKSLPKHKQQETFSQLSLMFFKC